MEYIDHHGRETAYRYAARGGRDTTCVFVHGSGADHRVWKSQDRLARDMAIAAIDLSGHGDSDDIATPPGSETLDRYAEDVQAVFEAVDGDVLVGNSLGGAVSMWVALEYECDLTGMCLVGTGAKLAVHERIRRMLSEDFDTAVETLHRPGWLLKEPESPLGEASRQAMYEVGRRITERDFLTCHKFDIRDRLDEIEVETLTIGGMDDRLTPPWYHEFLDEQIPQSRLVLVDDAAHLLMLEEPETFNEHLAAFVDELS